MKYLVFDMCAIETIVEKTEFQSREFALGKELICCITGESATKQINNIYVKRIDDKGVIFAGENVDKEKIFVFDLEQSGLLDKEKNMNDLLLVFQKSFRTAIRIWNRYPFTSSERIHESKSIIFPFAFTDHRRIVIERSVTIPRLQKRGITYPLLAYKYGNEDARKNETANLNVMKEAGEAYLDSLNEIRAFFRQENDIHKEGIAVKPLDFELGKKAVADKGFRFLPFETQMERLTISQKNVVTNPSKSNPIRIEGPAGTGKTMSMILRAYCLLSEAKKQGMPFKIIFFSHSESTNLEAKYAFSLLDKDAFYLEGNSQSIRFTSLFHYCIDLLNVEETGVIEQDAGDAKQFQRLCIEDALKEIMASKYKTYRPLLSEEMKKLFDRNPEENGILIAMLQHEFGVQIKGRTDCTIEEYYKLQPIKNALPAETRREKDFIFSIFNAYQEMLRKSSVFDSDDITIQALSLLNAPFWRREREYQGYDYIFVDEMHLFNINEQHVFHYLTKDIMQKNIPVCFALDYGQAIGDRGNIERDYIEKMLPDTNQNQYQTVFRSSQEITDFCACISASGALMFQTDYRNSYSTPISGFTNKEEELCTKPLMYLYADDNEMLASIKLHIDRIRREMQCDNKEIAIITFDNEYLEEKKVEELKGITGTDIFVLRDRLSLPKEMETIPRDHLILSAPNNVNGLEFEGVILIGVDDGRVPQTKSVDDVSSNYIRYIAFNQLYLASSRAQYRLILLGNEVHGVSPCLQYAIESECLITEQKGVPRRERSGL